MRVGPYRPPGPGGGGGARGYTPFKTEIAKGASAVDLKEFWHVGRELPAGHHYADKMSPNVWPNRPEGFKATFLELFTAFDRAELTRILDLYGRMVAAGHWRDYALDLGHEAAVFSAFRRAAERPELRMSSARATGLVRSSGPSTRRRRP